MTSQQEPRYLAIQLHGKRIGTLTRLASDSHIFAFDDAYLEDRDRPTLSLSFKRAGGGLIEATRSYRQKVPPFFSNLLPEGHLRDYIARQFGVHTDREFILLSRLGADLPGAVTAVPVAEDGAPFSGDGEAETSLSGGPDALRFSLAGVQLKFSGVLGAAGKLTIPANGIGGRWIIKLPSPAYPGVPENEFAMLELARAMDIEVPEVRLVAPDDIGGLPGQARVTNGNALMVKRFDRDDKGGFVHMEDFAQVFGYFPAAKYENSSAANIAHVLLAESGAPTVEEFFRRLVFNTFIGNGDMHLKNWSLLYRDRVTPVLAPAYDYVSTIAYMLDDSHALGFGGVKGLGNITVDQVRRFADKAAYPPSPLWRIVEEIRETLPAVWSSHSARACMPPEIDVKIDAHIRKVAASISATSDR